MRYLWQAILHRWYMGYWPSNNPPPVSLLSQGIVCLDEMNLSRRQIDLYIDPVIHQEIDRFLADVLEE